MKYYQPDVYCSLCDITYCEKFVYYHHLIHVHNILPYQCPNCNKSYKTAKELKYHKYHAHLKLSGEEISSYLILKSSKKITNKIPKSQMKKIKKSLSKRQQRVNQHLVALNQIYLDSNAKQCGYRILEKSNSEEEFPQQPFLLRSHNSTEDTLCDTEQEVSNSEKHMQHYFSVFFNVK